MQWEQVDGATGYNIYWAREPYITSANIHAYTGGDWQQGVSPPYTVSGLNNDTTYYFVVTATQGSSESDDSVEVSATPETQQQQDHPSAQEVLMLELVNRARFDPEAEAARFGIDLNDDLSSGTISPAQKQPLAPNRLLRNASREHDQWMLNNDIFSHTGINGSNPGDRMAAAGYNFIPPYTYGENISVRGTSASVINKTSQIYSHHEGLFRSAGHRVNILADAFREAGMGQRIGTFYFSGSYNDWFLSSMLTQSFARSGSSYFVTGVIYNDSNGNDFYDVGEGIENATVTIGGTSVTTPPSGIYAIARSNGTYNISVSGGGINVSDSVTVNDSNRKFDVLVSGGETSVNTW